MSLFLFNLKSINVSFFKFSLLFIALMLLSFHSNAQYFVDFEGDGETKGSYAKDTVNLSGLDLELEQALIGTSENDKKNGERALRMRRSDDISVSPPY